MNLNYSIILDNLTSPILIAKPVKDKGAKIVDFDIIYTNDEFKKAAGYILQDYLKWSDFDSSLTSDVPYFDMALKTIAGIPQQDLKFFSPATEQWYKVDMNYIAEEEYLVAIFSNITTERKNYQQLKRGLITDALTGFMNRSGFRDALSITLETNRFNKKNAALLIIDIDNLQNVNDSRGIKEGDELILQVAGVLKQFMREYIQVFRYGDDEFTVIISNFDSQNSLVNFIDCIYEAFQIKEIGVSGGIAIFPEHTEQQDELVRFADMAVHYAKKNGKNNFVYFEPDMQRVFIQHLTLQTKMTNAILSSSFVQYYQPQFDIRTGELRGFEALIRWKDEELGDVAPSVFIPLAEETGLIIPIGRWVLNSAISTLKTWQDKYDFKGVMSVNVSPIQLKQEEFLYELDNLIEKYKINPNLLEIEITEGVMINNMNDTIEKLQSIKDRGLRVSLDDFGTGYSSLSYLQMLPLNTLKIDKAFINGITAEDGIQANITSCIINMVEKMGLETIAEGVEHPEQLALLNKLKCTIVQGFLRGKPMPFHLCDAYLAGDKSALLKNNSNQD